jgi:MSHA biogenesis protein MshI
MGLFSKTKKSAGSIVINFQKDGICAASITRSALAQPEVKLLAFFPDEKTPTPASLEKLAKEVHADRYACSTLLASNEYQILSVDAPNVPAEELKTAIRWRLKDMLDFHVDDATIDVLDVPVDKNAAARNHSMYAIAARNKLIEQRQILFGEAKIPLTVIDVPEMAQRNISALLEQDGRGLALLSFDADGGLLTVTYAGELYLSRRIDVTLHQLQQSNADQRRACHDRITLELQRSLDHFERQYNSITLAKLVLAPMSDESADLQHYLASNLYLPVEALNLQSVFGINEAPQLKSIEVQQRFFITLGAALRYEEKAL